MLTGCRAGNSGRSCGVTSLLEMMYRGRRPTVIQLLYSQYIIYAKVLPALFKRGLIIRRGIKGRKTKQRLFFAGPMQVWDARVCWHFGILGNRRDKRGVHYRYRFLFWYINRARREVVAARLIYYRNLPRCVLLEGRHANAETLTWMKSYLSIITGSEGVSFLLPQLFLSQHRLEKKNRRRALIFQVYAILPEIVDGGYRGN